MVRCGAFAVIVVLAGFLAGCGVAFEHPLSDDETSVLDDRLVGCWEQVMTGEDVGKPAMRLAIGRVKGDAKGLEWVALDWDENGVVQVHRFPIRTTQLGTRRYLSASSQDAEDGWLILVYDMPDDDTVRLFLPDKESFVAAIEKGHIEGTVKNSGILGKTAVVSAGIGDLRGRLLDRAEEYFDLDEGATLRRLEFEQESTSAPTPPPEPTPPEESD